MRKGRPPTRGEIEDLPRDRKPFRKVYGKPVSVNKILTSDKARIYGQKKVPAQDTGRGLMKQASISSTVQGARSGQQADSGFDS